MKNYLYIFIAGVLWGTIGLFVTIMERLGSSSAYTSFLRMFLGMILLIIITLVSEGPKAFKVSKRTLFACILMGLVCQAIYNVAYSSAVSAIGMALSSVLLYTAPVFTTIMSLLFFGEQITKKKWTALFINVIGCALTVTGGSFDGLSFQMSGLLLGVAAGFCYSLAAIFGRIAIDEKSTFAVSTYNFLFASLFLGIFNHPWTEVANPFKPSLLLVGLLFALIPTALGYIFYFNGLQDIKESSKVPVVASIETVVATLIGVLVLKEQIGWVNGIGIVLVVGSILVMNLKVTDLSESQTI